MGFNSGFKGLNRSIELGTVQMGKKVESTVQLEHVSWLGDVWWWTRAMPPCYSRLPHTDIQLHSTLPWRHKYEHRFEYSKLTKYDRWFTTSSRKSTEVPVHATNEHMRGRGVKQVQLLSLTSALNRVERTASGPGRFTPEATPGTYWIQGWVGPPTTGVDALEKKRKIPCPCRESSQCIT